MDRVETDKFELSAGALPDAQSPGCAPVGSPAPAKDTHHMHKAISAPGYRNV
ncbi:hypothetical protein [Arthrobacter sp. U41]|uniref:hypothetical protein n=1 Tax=Arthrobacter sp. U41 TaxID=1849032 RepID=UPI0012F927AA|nr:hypothetical protein [Arthrobacter sp. U41]